MFVYVHFYICVHTCGHVCCLYVWERGDQPLFYEYRVLFSWALLPPSLSILLQPQFSTLPRNGSVLNWMAKMTLMPWLHRECVCPLLWGCGTSRSGSRMYSSQTGRLCFVVGSPIACSSRGWSGDGRSGNERSLRWDGLRFSWGSLFPFVMIIML